MKRITKIGQWYFKIFIFSMKLSIWNIFHNLYNFFELLFHTEYSNRDKQRMERKEWKNLNLVFVLTNRLNVLNYELIKIFFFYPNLKYY